MNPEIERTIEQLEAKIAELERARDTLVENFCTPDSPRRRALAARQASPATGSALPYEPGTTVLSGGRIRRRLRRKDIVAEFLRQHGPSTRAQILAGAGIPPGSVAFVLNDKAWFFLKDGKWHNVESHTPSAGAPQLSTETPELKRQEPEAKSEQPSQAKPRSGLDDS